MLKKADPDPFSVNGEGVVKHGTSITRSLSAGKNQSCAAAHITSSPCSGVRSGERGLSLDYKEGSVGGH